MDESETLAYSRDRQLDSYQAWLGCRTLVRTFQRVITQPLGRKCLKVQRWHQEKRTDNFP